MANPENLISVPLAELRFLAPVVGTLSRDRGYEALGEWRFNEEQADFVALAMRRTVAQPLLGFGVAPSVQVGYRLTSPLYTALTEGVDCLQACAKQREART